MQYQKWVAENWAKISTAIRAIDTTIYLQGEVIDYFVFATQWKRLLLSKSQKQLMIVYVRNINDFLFQVD